jgi:hypothetical protein
MAFRRGLNFELFGIEVVPQKAPGRTGLPPQAKVNS